MKYLFLRSGLLMAFLLSFTPGHASNGWSDVKSSPQKLAELSITALNPSAYSVATMNQGTQYYTDRDYTITQAPAILLSQQFIKTANDDKTSTSSDLISFSINQTAEVYVAYDARAISLPDWMEDFVPVGQQIITTDNGANLDLFRKTYSAGTVSLGGNLASGANGARSNYIVIVAADADSEPPPPTNEVVKINFQPANAAVPTGYVPDAGNAYGTRNGYTYGWLGGSNNNTRDRNANPDQRFDTFNHMRGETWEVGLPNGDYRVDLLMGDPTYSDQINTVSVEGVVRTDPDGQDNYDQYDNIQVTVADNKLTIKPTGNASNAKIAYVDIYPVDGTEPPTNYTITATAGANGSISPSGSVSVSAGSNQTFTISPNSGFVTSELIVDGSPVAPSGTYTFNEVSTDHTIRANFSAVTSTEIPMYESTVWETTVTDYSGNPYDIIAEVTFTHEDGSTQRKSLMYYDGGKRWKFKFAATKKGAWSYTTRSSSALADAYETSGSGSLRADSELDGLSGSFTVVNNSNTEKKGFLSHQGNKFAIQTGNDGKQSGYLFNVYMNIANYDVNDLIAVQNNPGLVDTYCAEALNNGAEIIFFAVNNNWFKLGAISYEEHSSTEPDRATFAVLENIVQRAAQNGCRVHFWAWGDNDSRRKWTPTGVAGGINGFADRRIQRYMMSRLGPMAGWSMGYSFDVDEWTNSTQRNSWAEYMHRLSGFDHLLSTRGFKLDGNKNNINSYSTADETEPVDDPLETTQNGPNSYEEIFNDLNNNSAANPNLPHFYEERHTRNRYTSASDENLHKTMWRNAMAGGMGFFYGFFDRSGNQAPPYPTAVRARLNIHYEFWQVNNRFLLDMVANSTGDTRILKSADRRNWVFYQENTSSITIVLTGLPTSLPVVAVDLKSGDYTEINKGNKGNGTHNIALGSTSDWAIAVGIPAPTARTVSRMKTTIPTTETLSNPTQSVSVYPNPAQEGELKIELAPNFEGVALSLINVNGAVVRVVDIRKVSQRTIPIRNLKNGVYFMKIVSHQGAVLTKKIIIGN